MHLAILCAS